MTGRVLAYVIVPWVMFSLGFLAGVVWRSDRAAVARRAALLRCPYCRAHPEYTCTADDGCTWPYVTAKDTPERIVPLTQAQADAIRAEWSR